jgi:cytochrome P450
VTEPAAPPAERLGEDFYQDPHAYFSRLRADVPVTPAIMPDGERVWLVTRYADVRAALADPRLQKDWVAKLTSPDWVPDEVTKYLNMHLLNSDPPDHTRLRKLVAKAFTPRRVAGLRPRVEAVTASLLDALEARVAAGEDTVDLLQGLAFPLPVTVICELLGVPIEDQDQFREWSNVIVAAVNEPGSIRAVGEAMYLYFIRLVAAKRARPADDLVSALIVARDADESGGGADSLSEHELIAMLFLLLIAGHETTTNLIASGTLALLTNPAELSRLRTDPALLPGAVEELLRHVNPLNHATERFTLEPVEIGGVTIPAREWVLCATASANRDPDRFPDADRLDVGRDAGGHLAFGHGIHFCVGAALTRLETPIAWNALLDRFPNIRLAPGPRIRRKPNITFRGLEALPLELR